MRVINPPVIDEGIDSKILFLAGAIQGAEDWQSKVINDLSDVEVCIANPRKRYLDKEFDYEKQVDWETYYLNRSDAIVFWIPKESEVVKGRSYAQTTRFELGEHLAKSLYNHKRIIVGIEDGFSGKRYINMRIGKDYPSVIFCDTYKNLIEIIKENLNDLFNG